MPALFKVLVLLVLCVGFGVFAQRRYGKATIPTWLVVAIGVGVPIPAYVGGLIYRGGLEIVLTVGPTLALLYLFVRRARHRPAAAPGPQPAPAPPLPPPAPPPAPPATATAHGEDRFCSRCGNAFLSDERFCANCGAPRGEP